MAAQRRERVVVITGGSAGVGRATAIAFARRGCAVGLVARGPDGLEGARRDVEAAGGRAHTVVADVADPGAVEAAAAEIEAQLGPIDVWVNNAMTAVFAPVKETPADEFRRVTEVTYLGMVYGTLAALRRMLPRDRGVIVQVGSALCYRGIPLQASYCGAKHACKGFFESLRSELIHDGSRIHLTMVHLPGLNTPQFRWVKSRLAKKAQPVPPIFQPELAADAIVWASEHRRREVVLAWPAVKVIWGNKFLAAYGDRYLARAGYDGQQTDEPRDPDQPFNLWEPVAGDHGAHGVFDDRAKRRSVQWWLSQRRGAVTVVAALLVLALIVVMVAVVS